MISHLSVKNFTRFTENQFQFSSGINLFIGKNSTGKTHLLKLLACVLKANKENQNGKDSLEKILTDKLFNYFKPESLGRLVKRAQGRNKAEILLTIQEKELGFDFATNSKNVRIEKYQKIETFNSLYLPPREIISIFEGFISLYANRETNFDETYYQLALALDLPLLKGRRFEEVQNLIEPLEQITESKVIKENGRFYLQNIQGKMEMSLIAEGYRKIATLMYLIANGEITQNSILFWDEPETNLNPKLTSKIVALLLALAQKGVQIFVASHDYLLTNLFSLKSEYKNDKDNEVPEIRFFGLYDDNDQLTFDEGSTLLALTQNPIFEEFTNLHNLESLYFNQTIKK